MLSAIAAAVGLAASAVFVGYLAYAINAVPLWIIVVVTYLLAILDFARDNARANERRRALADGDSERR